MLTLLAVGILEHYYWRDKLKSSLAARNEGIKIPMPFYLVLPFIGLYPGVVKILLIQGFYERLFFAAL